jgi:hypothetical protein
MPQEVRDGSIWTHRSARQYRVLFLANGREDVVYENYPNTDGTKWSAPSCCGANKSTAHSYLRRECRAPSCEKAKAAAPEIDNYG